MTDDARRWDVFLAHASPDKAIARTFRDRFVTAGLQVCFDEDAVQPGDDWMALLPRYLAESSVCVALISDQAGTAHYLQSEIALAVRELRSNGMRIVPVWLNDNVAQPYGTEQLNPIRAYDDAGRAAAATEIIDLIRNPDRLPPPLFRQVISPLVPRPNRFFVGRDAIVDQLTNAPLAATPTVQALTGMGGIGKSTIAAAVAERLRSEVDIIWWVRSEERSTLVADFANLAAALGIAIDGNAEASAIAGVRHLETTERSWLVVYDNAPDERSIHDWLPRHGSGRVLITSRSPSFEQVGSVVPVEELTRNASIQFLVERVATSNTVAADDVDLLAVVDELDGHALALEQAGAWVAKNPMRDFTAYRQLLTDATSDPFPDKTRPLDYHATASTTWQISIAAAEEDATGATALLSVMSWFAPDDIPLESTQAVPATDQAQDLSAAFSVEEALTALHDYSLIRLSENNTADVHRLVQSASRDAVPWSADAAIGALRLICPIEARDPRTWPAFRILAPHVTQLGRLSQPGESRCIDLVLLLNLVGTFQRDATALEAATESFALAVDHARRTFGTAHDATAVSENNLAGAFEATSRFDEAITLYEHNLATRSEALGPHHEHTLSVSNNLANAYLSAGRDADAISLWRATLATQVETLGNDHPDTLMTFNNLINSDTDNPPTLEVLEAVLDSCRRVFGADHLHTFVAQSNLAQAYDSDGNLSAAIDHFRQVVEGRQRVLGSRHVDTLHTVGRLATCFLRDYQIEPAQALLQFAVAESIELEPSHPVAVGLRTMHDELQSLVER